MRDYRFGNFLRELRERRGLSQYQLGRLVGVSDKAVSKWENGSAKPQSRLLYKLSDVLEITVDELLACKYRSAEGEAPKGVFSTKNKLWKQAHQSLRDRYGPVVPVPVLDRYLREYAELQSTDIPIYFELLRRIRTLEPYLLERGGIGASFVAFVMGATDINPLEPHYFCPHCHQIEFANTRCGWDLPPKTCSCGQEMQRDGHSLPFEAWRPTIHQTPHFDLALSPDSCPAVKELIDTYFTGNTVVTFTRTEHPHLRTVAILPEGALDLKNGQELPFEEYGERARQYPTFTLVIDEELHLYRRLEAESGTAFEQVPFSAPEVLEAFCKGDIDNIPDWRCDFLRHMIHETKPSSFYDLIQIAGLAHGTDTCAQIQSGRSVADVIAYQDDVFRYLASRTGSGYAYKIMEDTRRGVYVKGGLSVELRKQFASAGVEEWFLESIEKIRYLFPKAQGVLYVKRALILMWYKLYCPEVFVTLLREN